MSRTVIAVVSALAMLAVPALAGSAAAATFAAPVTIPAGGSPVDLASADFNGDGDPDLVAVEGDAAEGLTITTGAAGETFASPVAVLVDADRWVSRVAVGNFNGDGDPDLAVTKYESSLQGEAGFVSILLGGAGATFTAAADVSVGTRTNGVAVADFDGDGDADLATANSGTATVSIRAGAGDGTFSGTTEIAVSAVPVELVARDFNGDGDPDIAVTGSQSDVDGTGQLRILTGGAGVTFTASEPLIVGHNQGELASGDFNGDGDPDLAIPSTGGAGFQNLAILLGGTAATFSAPTGYAVGTALTSVAVGDLNGDGDPDLAVTDLGNGGDQVSALLGGAGGTFTGRTDHPVGLGAVDVAVAEFGGDDDLDLAVANRVDSTFTLLFGRVPPVTPSGLSTSPASQGSDDTPNILGTAAAGSTVRLYTTSDCTGTPLATGTAAAFASPGLTVAVSTGATTFRATASDAGGTSACSSPVTYTLTAPAAPSGLSTSPASSGEDNTPVVLGTAEAGSTVRIYTNSSCSGAVSATGTAAEFGGAGITVTVATGSTTTFWATASLGGTSPCSSSSVTYTSTVPPVGAFTQYPSMVTPTTAELHGNIGPTDGTTRCWFDYGITISSPQTTPSIRPVPGSGSNCAITVTGLSPSTLYHYRAAGQRDGETDVAYGSWVSFTTPAAGSGSGAPAANPTYVPPGTTTAPGETAPTTSEGTTSEEAGTTYPSTATIRSALERALTPSGRRARIRALLKAGYYRTRFAAPGAGTVKIKWYSGRTVIAAGSARPTATGEARFKLRLSRKGKAILRKAKRAGKSVRVTGKGNFAAANRAGIAAKRRFRLKL